MIQRRRLGWVDGTYLYISKTAGGKPHGQIQLLKRVNEIKGIHYRIMRHSCEYNGAQYPQDLQAGKSANLLIGRPPSKLGLHLHPLIELYLVVRKPITTPD